MSATHPGSHTDLSDRQVLPFLIALSIAAATVVISLIFTGLPH